MNGYEMSPATFSYFTKEAFHLMMCPPLAVIQSKDDKSQACASKLLCIRFVKDNKWYMRCLA